MWQIRQVHIILVMSFILWWQRKGLPRLALAGLLWYSYLNPNQSTSLTRDQTTTTTTSDCSIIVFLICSTFFVFACAVLVFTLVLFNWWFSQFAGVFSLFMCRALLATIQVKCAKTLHKCWNSERMNWYTQDLQGLTSAPWLLIVII